MKKTQQQTRVNTLLRRVTQPSSLVVICSVIIFASVLNMNTPKSGQQETPVEMQLPQVTHVAPSAEAAPQELPFSNYSGALAVSPDTVRASLASFFALEPRVLVEINLAQQLADEISTNDLALLDAFANGNAAAIRLHGQWFVDNSTTPEVSLAREQLRQDYDFAARYLGFGIGTVTWVQNSALVLEALGYGESANALRFDLGTAVQAEIALAQQMEQQANSNPLPTAQPQPQTQAEIPTEVLAEVAQVQLDETMAQTGIIPLAPTEAPNGIGLGHSRLQMLYSLKRIYAWLKGFDAPSKPVTPYIVDIEMRKVLPWPIYELDIAQDWDPEHLEVGPGVDIYRVLMLASDDPTILPMDSWNEWIDIAVWGDTWEGWELGTDGQEHYWHAMTVVWIYFGENQFPIEVGDTVDSGGGLVDLLLP